MIAHDVTTPADQIAGSQSPMRSVSKLVMARSDQRVTEAFALEIAVGFPALMTPAVRVDIASELARDDRPKPATAIPATRATATIFR
jgi:hypothetical protein